jgi:hypothetical protein
LLGEVERPFPNMLGTIIKYLHGSRPMPGPISQSFSQCLPENQDGYTIALLRSSFIVPHVLYANLAPLSVAPSLSTKSPNSKTEYASLSAVLERSTSRTTRLCPISPGFDTPHNSLKQTHITTTSSLPCLHTYTLQGHQAHTYRHESRVQVCRHRDAFSSRQLSRNASDATIHWPFPGLQQGI